MERENWILAFYKLGDQNLSQCKFEDWNIRGIILNGIGDNVLWKWLRQQSYSTLFFTSNVENKQLE